MREGNEGEGVKGWRVCKGCRVVQWCCEEHEQLGSEGHSEVRGADGRSQVRFSALSAFGPSRLVFLERLTLSLEQCQTLQLSTEIDEFHLRHSLSQAHLASPSPPSLWIPTRRLSSLAPLPESGWEAYLTSPSVAASLPTNPPPTTAQIYGIWLEALAPPLSFLSALRHLPSSQIDTSKSLTLHILEETHQSLSAWLPALEELGHQLPSLRSTEIRACAPTITTSGPSAKGVPLPVCPECKLEGKERKVVSCGGISSASKAGSLQAAVVWNRSFAQSDPEAPWWKDQLRLLFSPSSSTSAIPLIWFSLTAEESADELEALLAWARVELRGEEKVDVLWRPERNEWSGGWPRVDLWEEDGVVRRGEWSFAVQRKL